MKENSNESDIMNYKKIACCCVKALFLFKITHSILLESFNTISSKSRSYNMLRNGNLLFTSRTLHTHPY